MAKKISQLPAVTALNSTDEIEVNQGGVSKKAKISDIISTNGTDAEQVNISVTGTVYNLSFAPTFIYGVYVNGQRYTNLIDYTVAGNVVTFTNALAADSVTISYKY